MLDLSDAILESLEPIKEPKHPFARFSWVVRVVGDGSDKSDYQIVRVLEEPGTQAEELTLWVKTPWVKRSGKPRKQTKFKRNGATVWQYRAEARADKKTRKWKTNVNSYANQASDGYW